MELNGMRVYSDRAKFIGAVEDAVIDDKEGNVVGLVFGRRAGKALTIPYNSIMAVGDIVLVYSKKAEAGGSS
jgi:sporulation protein YlmC with PRC-barrel domain